MNTIVRNAALGLLSVVTISLSAGDLQKTAVETSLVMCSDGSVRCDSDILQKMSLFSGQYETFNDCIQFDCSKLSYSRLLQALDIYQAASKNYLSIENFSALDLKNALFDLDMLGLRDADLLKELCIAVMENKSIRLNTKEKEIVTNIAPYPLELLIFNGSVGAQNLKRNVFDLSSLDLSTIGGIEHIACSWQVPVDQVTALDLSKNRIYSIVHMCNHLNGVFSNLKSIDLSANKIARLTKSDLQALKRACPLLESLRLDANLIVKLDEDVVDILEGLTINLQDNPLVSIPMNRLSRVEGVKLIIASTPLAQELLYQGYKGFRKIHHALETVPTRVRRLKGFASQAAIRASLVALTATVSALSNYAKTVAPNFIAKPLDIFKAGLKTYAGLELVLPMVTIAIAGLDDRARYDMEQDLSSGSMAKPVLDHLASAVFPSYGKPYRPTSIYCG